MSEARANARASLSFEGDMQVSAVAWALFGAIIVAMLAIDLGAFRGTRGASREMTPRSAALWTAAWIGLALLFGFVVLAFYGPSAALTYLTAYLLEKSLSIDNIFVFVLIFAQLQIPEGEQRRVLYWGVLGALVMRALLIAAGVYLLERFHWVIYPFAVLVILAAVRMVAGREKERAAVAAACAVCGSWVARLIRITPVLRGGRFWVRQGGRLVATPLFIALVVVETTDLIFALDSIPAVLSVTRDPFLVYTSNVFAMLGLRSLYFLLAGAVERFRYLRTALAAVLAFVGGKMLLGDVVEVPTWVSLVVIAIAIGLGVAISLARPPRPGARPATGEA
ncbi:MAG: TerC family protein [Gemmatimonadaceae bacterium]